MNRGIVCRYYSRGICRFGDLCHFSHDTSGIVTSSENVVGETINESTTPDDVKNSDSNKKVVTSTTTETSNPSTSKNWANAPVFVPRRNICADGANGVSPILPSTNQATKKTWAEVVSGNSSNSITTYDAEVVSGHSSSSTLTLDAGDLCEFTKYGNIITYDAGGGLTGALCLYGSTCPSFDICPCAHIDVCHMCDRFCLHPTDENQRRKHYQDCLKKIERDMEYAFAIDRSKDKTCGICFDTIIEKSGREKRFGILPNCCHTFCLECIRKWRKAKQFEPKITRSCPECRVASDFVCPSAFWVDTKEEKDKLLNDYRSALGVKDCKYFKKGDGKCPFGNKCFYKHALPNGDLVDVGNPKRGRKLHRSTDELIDLLDIYLWDFVDQRDYHWLELLSNPTDSDDSDWSDDE